MFVAVFLMCRENPSDLLIKQQLVQAGSAGSEGFRLVQQVQTGSADSAGSGWFRLVKAGSAGLAGSGWFRLVKAGGACSGEEKVSINAPETLLDWIIRQKHLKTMQTCKVQHVLTL